MNEEDIRILEEFLNIKTIDNKVVFTEKFLEVFKDPIRNILKRNQELEFKNIELNEKLSKRSWVKIKKNGSVEPLFYIPKSKIEKKIKVLKDFKEKTRRLFPEGTVNEFIYNGQIEILREMLEEEETND